MKKRVDKPTSAEIKAFFKQDDYKPLRDYIKDNFYNVQPNILTLERLEQIKQNIMTWKSQLKEMHEALDLQDFIDDTIVNIDFRIKRRTNTPSNKAGAPGQKTKPAFTPKRFAELFTDPDLVDGCLDLLREIEKPCINEKNEFLRHKGVFAVWLNALEFKGVIGRFIDDYERAETLKYNFKGLSISESLVRRYKKRASEHQSDFTTGIDEVVRKNKKSHR